MGEHATPRVAEAIVKALEVVAEAIVQALAVVAQELVAVQAPK